MECPRCGVTQFEWIGGAVCCVYCGMKVTDTNPVKEKKDDEYRGRDQREVRT